MLKSRTHLPITDPSNDAMEIPKKNACPGTLAFCFNVTMNLSRHVNPIKVPIRMNILRRIRAAQIQTGTGSCWLMDPALVQVELVKFIDVTRCAA